jgi:hypothetical protein
MTHLDLLRPLPHKINAHMSRRVLVGVMVACAMLSVEAKVPGTERIEAVVLRQGYSMGYGGAITLEYKPAVLFRDGSYSEDTARALEGNARVDGRWQRSGGGWALTPSKGKPVDVSAKMLARPAKAGATLDGAYRSLSGVGGPNANVAMVAAWKNVQFSSDGTMRQAQGAGADAGSVVTASSKAIAARYQLSGYSIAMTYPDGHTETKLFYLFPDSDNAIGLGGSTLSKRR